MNRRILFFTPSLGAGGAETHIVRLGRGLKQSGHTISFYSTQGNGILGQRIRDIEIFDNGRQSASSSLSVLTAIPKFAKIIRQWNPDIIFSITPLGHIATAASIALARFKGIHVPLCQNNPTFEFDQLPLGIKQIIKMTDLACLKQRALVISLSHGVKSEYLKLGIDSRRMAVIHNAGFDANIDILRQEKCPLTKSKNIKIICSVGRFVHQKDHQTLLRAMHLVIQKEPSSVLWLIGDGPMREELEILSARVDISNSVVFVGRTPNPYMYLEAADVFCLTSRYEGFANVITEAMACGLPVVSTDCDFGPREIIRDGIDGHLCPVGDFASVATCILKIISDSEYRSTMSKSAKARSLIFHPNATTQRYIELIDSLTHYE